MYKAWEEGECLEVTASLQVQIKSVEAKSRKEMIRDLNKTRNERRVFFTTPQRKISGKEATVPSIPVQ